jgi:quinohemoprotein ethanol dehydrogenase
MCWTVFFPINIDGVIVSYFLSRVFGTRIAFSGMLFSVLATAMAQPATPLAPAFTSAELMHSPTDAWITNGGNLYNQRYSPLEKINRDSVGTLKANWRTHLNGSGLGANYSGQGQTLFHEGVLYVTTGASDVFALDVATGAIVWRYEAHLDPSRVKVCCGWMNRGVALGEGLVYVGQLDAKLVALDQRTGKVRWSIQAEDPLKGYSIVSAPLYYQGMLITGFGGGDMGIRGRIKAYDAKNGKLLWTFYTIPGPGERGHDTWPADSEVWKFGGASIWQTPSVDPELGLLYFSTGNAAPDYNGSIRKGDNLFTASILALDVKTGRYRWHFQQVHHDIWDYDSPNPTILFDAPIQGRLRKGIAQASKTGWIYVLDRETGKPLLPIEERPVPQDPRQHTAATQPHVIGDSVVPQKIDIAPEGFKLINQGRIFTPFWDEVVIYKPQMGVNHPPSSYDPKTHRMFVCGIDHVATSISDRKEFTLPKYDSMWFGGSYRSTGVPPLGTFTAMDLTTNRIVWQQQWPASACWSGSLATGGGLVFVGRSDGRLTALNSDDGRRLWQFQTDAGVHAPPTTFEWHNQQYVAVLSAGSLFGGSRNGDSVWLFSLSGQLESLPPPSATPPAIGVAFVLPEGVPDTIKGKKLFIQFCVACHGETGTGGHGGGPSLVNAAKDLQTLAATADQGRKAMPSFHGALTPEQLRDIAGHIAYDLFATQH